MIDFKIDKGNVEMRGTGDVTELTADALTMIHAVYTRLNDEAKEMFRMGVEESVKSGDLWCTQEELEKKAEEKLKKREKRKDEIAKMFFDAFKEIIKDKEDDIDEE